MFKLGIGRAMPMKAFRKLYNGVCVHTHGMLRKTKQNKICYRESETSGSNAIKDIWRNTFFFESIIFGYVWKVMERPLQLYKNANTSRNLHGILNGSELLIHVILSNYYVLF